METTKDSICDPIFYEMFRIGKSMETEKVISGCQGLGGGEWRVIAHWIQVSFWGDENVLKLNVVMVPNFVNILRTIHLK